MAQYDRRMSQYVREQLRIAVGMLTALEYCLGLPNGAAEVARDVKDIINDVLEGELTCLVEKR